jgi:hypothetical protein
VTSGEQLSLPGTVARARSSDPWTSHAAARSLDPATLRETQRCVLDCFRRFGAMHHERLVDEYDSGRRVLGWRIQSVSGLRTRTKELVDAGFLRDSGRTVRLRSGRRSIVWEPVA